jgi:uncharacterized cupin superfamily protein
MSKSIMRITPATLDLEAGEIPAEWLLSGDPKTRGKVLLRTNDFLAQVVVWECGAVSYKWHYNIDEAYIVISGEGFMTDESGEERRFGAGDVAFFPAGASTTWRHPDHFKKVAFLKESYGRPVGFCLKVCSKLLRVLGIKGGSPFLFVLAAWAVQNLGESRIQRS